MDAQQNAEMAACVARVAESATWYVRERMESNQRCADMRAKSDASMTVLHALHADAMALMAEARAVLPATVQPPVLLTSIARTWETEAFVQELANNVSEMGTVNVLGRCANIVPLCENIFIGPVLIGELVYECKVGVSCASLPLDVVVRVGDVLCFDAECHLVTSSGGSVLSMLASNVRNLHLVNKQS